MICEHLSGRPVQYAPTHRCELVAVGSLLRRLNRSHRLHRLGLKRSLDIWGTGSLDAGDTLAGKHRVHALRGRLTQQRVAAAPAQVALGDPGLLADRITPLQPKNAALGIVPHLVDRQDPGLAAFLEAHPRAVVIDIGADVREVLGAISACEALVSSSLHGLVFADALNVPNRWIRISDRVLGGRHKYDDYYSAFGLSAEPWRLDQVDVQAIFDGYARPGLEQLKAGLERSFPYR